MSASDDKPAHAKAAEVALPVEMIQQRILVIRGHKVMLDSDLADLYDVETKMLVRAMKVAGAGRRTPPYAFTEQGVAMLSGVLRSDRAVAVNIAIMRAFAQLRQMLATHADLARKLDDMEKRYDAQFAVVFDAIRQLMEPPPVTQRPIGFTAPDCDDDA